MTARVRMLVAASALVCAVSIGFSPAGLPTGVSVARADDSCTNGQYAFDLHRSYWATRRYAYFANVSRTGAQGRRAITAGHHSFDNTINNCGFNDGGNITSDYIGDCSATNCTVHSAPDEQSVIDFGSIGALGGCNDMSIACAKQFIEPTTRTLRETDQRYSSSVNWWTETTTGAPNTSYHDLWAAAAHESGHSIGLGHASSSSFLTMYHALTAGQSRWRTLARGDVLGMRARYP